MARYGAGASRSGVNTANTPLFQFRPTGSGKRILIRELGIGISVAPTTAPLFGLSRSTAVGTASTTLAGLPNDASAPAASATLDSAFSTAPTYSTTGFIRLGGLAVTAGGLLIWTFYDEPLVLADDTAKGYVLSDINPSGTTTGTFYAYASWDEG